MNRETIDEVRLAGPNDETGLVAMVRAMHEDPDFGIRDSFGKQFPFNEVKARSIIQRATQRKRNEPDAGFEWIGVIGAPEHLMGSAYVAVLPTALSDGAYLAELWNWVYPQHRHQHEVTESLLEFSVAVADELHLSLTCAATRSATRAARERFYARFLGDPVGALYNYVPPPRGPKL